MRNDPAHGFVIEYLVIEYLLLKQDDQDELSRNSVECPSEMILANDWQGVH
jgi:hypothetical protein